MAFPAVTNNSPSAGSIAWAAFTIQYMGQVFSVPAGSTANRWVWWKYNGGAPTLVSGAEVPQNLTDDDLVLFANKNGIGIRVQSASLLDGELLVDGSILADAIAVNQVNSQHITTLGLDAGVIKFGEMSGELISVGTLLGNRIVSGSIAVSKLTVADMNNYVADGFLIDPLFSNWDQNGLTRVPESGNDPAYIQWSTVANGNAHRYNLHDFEVRPGEEFYFVCEVSTPASNTVNVNVIASLQSYAATGATVTWPQAAAKNLAPNSAWQEYSGTIVIPANVEQVRAQWDPFANSGATAGQIIRMRKMQLIKKNNGKMIVDGAIQTNHIVTNTLEGHVIKTNTLNGDRVLANTIAGAKMIADTITTREINFIPAFQDGIAVNPSFDDWDAANALPNAYTTWNTNPTRETATTKSAGPAMRWNVGATNAGVNTASAWTGLSSNEPYVVLTVDFQLVSGNLTGAGVLLDFGNASGGRVVVKLIDEIPAPVFGRWYRFTKVVPRPAGYTANAAVAGYIMANWDGMATLTAKDIIYDFVDLRAATKVEIDAYIAGTWKQPGMTTINGGSIQTSTLSAEAITSDSLRTKIINAGTINSMTITGSTFQTATSGNRMVIRNDGAGGIIEGFSGHANEVSPAVVDPGFVGTTPTGVSAGYISVLSPNVNNIQSGIYLWAATASRGIDIYGDTYHWQPAFFKSTVTFEQNVTGGARSATFGSFVVGSSTFAVSGSGGAAITGSSFNLIPESGGSTAMLKANSVNAMSVNRDFYANSLSMGTTSPGTQVIDSARNITAASISGSSLSAGSGAISGGSLNIGSGTATTGAVNASGRVTVSAGGMSVNGQVVMNDYIKAGTVSVNVTAINTNATATVTFGTAFAGTAPVPTVVLSVQDVTGATTVKASASSVTRSGFTVNLVRSAGTGATTVAWVAIAS